MVAVDFYDQVLRELLLAVGAALFLANLVALVRRRGPVDEATRSGGIDDGGRQLTRAPVARTVTFMLIGLIVMIWGIASLLG